MEVNNLRINRIAQIGDLTIPLLKGEQGEQGYSISRIARTDGDGTPGTIDTYTIYIDTTPETAIGTFQVANGTGADMSKNVYDIDNDDIVDRATGDGNGNEITATYETIENVTALASRVATLEQAGYITKSVADLANYYLKSETYTKQEVNNLCDMIPKFAIEVVSVLPTQDISETTIYLLRDDEETQDVYQEYIYVNNTWERIGGQRIDLSNYYQKSEVDNLLNDKADTSDLDNYYTKNSVDDLLKILQPINNYLSAGTNLNTIVDNGTYVLMSGVYINCFTTKTIKTSILIVERAFTGTSASDSNQNVIVQTIINREKPYEIHKRTIYGRLSNLNFKEWIEITTDNDYYQITSGADLNNYFKEGKGYLLSGTYTNAPKASMPTSIFKVEKVSTLKGDTFEDNSICCLQTIIPRDCSAYYIRSIYYQYDSQSTKYTTPWVNIIDKAQKESINILTLGDSILGMPNQYITDTIGNYTSGNVYNCNFGGTTAVDRTGSHFQAFSFVNLVDAKIANSYTSQDSALSYDDIPDYFSTSLTRFKNVDMSSIDICLVMYGTNDFNSNYPIGNITDNNKTSILGSLRYGIEKLSEEYPNIRFIILNPIYRVFNNDATQNSKTYTNTNNEKLIDVDTAEINLANDMLISNIDMIKIGINENNYSHWLVDGVHFKDNVKSKIGSIIANNMLNI